MPYRGEDREDFTSLNIPTFQLQNPDTLINVSNSKTDIIMMIDWFALLKYLLLIAGAEGGVTG